MSNPPRITLVAADEKQGEDEGREDDSDDETCFGAGRPAVEAVFLLVELCTSYCAGWTGEEGFGGGGVDRAGGVLEVVGDGEGGLCDCACLLCADGNEDGSARCLGDCGCWWYEDDGSVGVGDGVCGFGKLSCGDCGGDRMEGDGVVRHRRGC